MDEKVLQEAVELARGFTYYGDTDQYFGPGGLKYLSRQYIAALASQLIEQVDATDNAEIEIYRGCTSVWHSRLKNKRTDTNGPNRDENSINAIVESKLLTA